MKRVGELNFSVVQRFVDEIVALPDGQIFDVITNGVGLMPGYRWPIPPSDRWAIVAYVRALQRERMSRAASTNP